MLLFTRYGVQMQKYLLPLTLSLFLLNLPQGALASEDALGSIRQLANLIYRSSQDMVTHGSDGHVWEIALYGKKMVQRTEILLEKVESTDASNFKKKKGKIIASIKGTLIKAREALEFAEQEKGKLALTAARKASFQAKRLRQRLLMIR